MGTDAEGSKMRDRMRSGFARLPPGARRQVLHAMGRYAPWEQQFDFTPPTLDTGEHQGPPDFVGIGVQKAGTTWWYHLVLSHPDVWSRPGVHKERHFFDRFGAEPMTADDIAQYQGWFPRRSGTVTGEWTPDYFTYPWVPQLLHRVAPDAPLLLLLRDPIERFWSGLAHHRRMGHPRDGAAMADAAQRGLYHQALAHWRNYFPAEQILVLQYERCLADADGQLARTFDHLGLPPHRVAHQQPPRTAPKRSHPDDEVQAYLVELYTPEVAALTDLVPELDLALWPNFA